MIKTYAELTVLKQQKELDRYNRKQEKKELKKAMFESVLKLYSNKCSQCGSEASLTMKKLCKGTYNPKNAILLCKSCRKERKQNPMVFYWKLIKQHPAILKSFMQ